VLTPDSKRSPLPAAPGAKALAGAAPPRGGWAHGLRSITGVAVCGFVLVLAVLAAVLVQARQHAQMQHLAQNKAEAQALAVSQVEADFWRLREQWRQALDETQPLDAGALQQKAARWASGVQALYKQLTPSGPVALDDNSATLEQAVALVARHQPLLANPAPARSLLAAELPALDAMATNLQRMAQGASQAAVNQREQRADALQQHSRLGVALTIGLSLLALALGSWAWRQLQRQREQRQQLAETTQHLHQARREAVAASEAKSAFLANMSHEIRTPFHGLMGMLSLLRETGLNRQQTDHLRTATESADHLLAVLNDILDVSQLESGRLSLAPAPADLRGLLREVEALMRPQATAKGLALHIDVAPGLPERVLADSTRVKQILFNLLSNAIKFSDRGAVTLDVMLRGDLAALSAGSNSAPTAALEFAVSDTGIGIDDTTQASLFNRFSQGDSSRSRRHAGAGLGLEISRNLARLMRGDITLSSRVGEGSCFTFRMPLTVVPSPAAVAPVGGDGAPPPRALQVLVAEDHPVNRKYMGSLLHSMGHVAHFAVDGHEAVAAARQRRFDLVLMDVHMPLLDGVAATRAIRALPDAARSTVPIVALTADAFDDTRNRCIVAGMNDFLSKPVSPDKLGSALRRLFGSLCTQPAPGSAQEMAQSAVKSATQVATQTARQTTRQTAASAAAQTGAHAQSFDRRASDLATNLGPSAAGVLDPGAIEMVLQTLSREQYAEMVQVYLEQAPETVQRLHSAVRDAQALELRVNAHAAKGAALNLGLTALAATAEALQQGAAHLPAHEIARLVQRYEGLVPTTQQALINAGLLPGAGFVPASNAKSASTSAAAAPHING
jgi:two-component system, sensor histidine kinase